MNKYFIINAITSLLLIIGCKNETTQTKDNFVKTSQIKFSKNKVNIGKFKSGSSQSINFYAKNMSETPLLIDTIQASCACTIGKFPKKPILKNDSGLIVVAFQPIPGVLGYFEKSIVVSSNTKPVFTVLTIEGEIVP